jgi:type 1 glutamine amidotransferase
LDRVEALVVRGGWDGHQPVECTDLFIPSLQDEGFKVTVAESLHVYEDLPPVDLIVQCWTDGRLTQAQEDGLLDAVRAGTGFAGWHGGIVATAYANAGYQYLVGGRFVGHPGGFVDYSVEIHPGHTIVDGIETFAVHTEQYFCHFDPTITVLATTTFTGDHGAPETNGAMMPVVWTRRFGAGRVFVSTLGHAPSDLLVGPTRAITTRGLLWAAKPPGSSGGSPNR